jgi:tRNA(fMet)-specific endonuclease VapC
MAINPRQPDVLVVLDTDVLNDWRYKVPTATQSIDEYIRVVKVPPAIPSHTIFEIMHGFEKAIATGTTSERTRQDRALVLKLISNCPILPFNQDAAQIAAHIFPRLTNSQRNQHWNDMFIAATALAHDYGVATRNQKHFELMAQHTPQSYPPLRVEIWKS